MNEIMNEKHGTLRVWWHNNNKIQDYHPVKDVKKAMKKLKELEKRDLADDTVTQNAGGLEVLDGEYDYIDPEDPNLYTWSRGK